MTREEALSKAIMTLIYFQAHFCKSKEAVDNTQAIIDTLEQIEQEPCEDMGEVSDGYHTFNQLYHQRAVLFACIVNQNKDKAWKSFKHSDGKYCFDSNGEWFIVGVDTPQGSYTYHYEKKYWDMFDCKELQCGKEWDGHTEEDVTRLLSLEQKPCEDAISKQAALDQTYLWSKDEFLRVTNPFDYLRKRINSLPSVTPKHKMGKWIESQEHVYMGNGVKEWTNWYCSECDAPNCNPSDFCPNCGAKMQEVKK